MTATFTAKAPSPFEHTTCSRCGGSGEYSYCLSYGTRCFKCGGAGWTFTARGQAAANLFVDSLKVRVEDVQVGQTVRVEGVPGYISSFWLKVETISEPRISSKVWRQHEGGTEEWDGKPGTWVPTLSVDFSGTRKGRPASASFNLSSMVRIGHTAEEKAPKLEDALAYQQTLTKAGKPRKR